MLVVHQLSLMKCRPFNDHGRRTIRKLSFKNNYGINPKLRLIPGVNGMEVRRIMLVEIHANHDAKETADFWHLPPSYHAVSHPKPATSTPCESDSSYDSNPQSR